MTATPSEPPADSLPVLWVDAPVANVAVAPADAVGGDGLSAALRPSGSTVSVALPASGWLNDGDRWVLVDDDTGLMIPCDPGPSRGDEPGVWIDVPVCQYVTFPRGSNSGDFSTGYAYSGFNVLAGVFHWPDSRAKVYARTPDLPASFLDAVDYGATLSASFTDWTGTQTGPVEAVSLASPPPKHYAKLKGYFGAWGEANAWDGGKPIAAGGVAVRYVAAGHALTLTPTASVPDVPVRYALHEFDAAGQPLAHTPPTPYVGPVSLRPDTARYGLTAYLDAVTRHGLTHAAWTHAFPTRALPVPRVDDEQAHDRFAALGLARPTIAVLATTTENEGEMALRVYPPNCDVYWLPGRADDTDFPSAAAIKETGRRYTGPLAIAEGQCLYVHAEHRTVEGWTSPVYAVRIPPPKYGRRFFFHRLYHYADPPVVKVHCRTGMVFTRPTTGWFASPGGAGTGKTPDDPCSLADAVARAAATRLAGQVIHCAEGVYEIHDYPRGNAAYAPALLGGYAPDFRARDPHAHRSVLRQMSNAVRISPGDWTCALFDGFYGEIGPGVDRNIALFNGPICRNCHVENLSAHLTGLSRWIRYYDSYWGRTSQYVEGPAVDIFYPAAVACRGENISVTTANAVYPGGAAPPSGPYISIHHARGVSIDAGRPANGASGEEAFSHGAGGHLYFVATLRYCENVRLIARTSDGGLWKADIPDDPDYRAKGGGSDVHLDYTHSRDVILDFRMGLGYAHHSMKLENLGEIPSRARVHFSGGSDGAGASIQWSLNTQRYLGGSWLYPLSGVRLPFERLPHRLEVAGAMPAPNGSVSIDYDQLPVHGADYSGLAIDATVTPGRDPDGEGSGAILVDGTPTQPPATTPIPAPSASPQPKPWYGDPIGYFPEPGFDDPADPHHADAYYGDFYERRKFSLPNITFTFGR